MFDRNYADEPDFGIKTGSVRTDPGYFYLDQNAEKIRETGLFD